MNYLDLFILEVLMFKHSIIVAFGLWVLIALLLFGIIGIVLDFLKEKSEGKE